MKKFWGPEFSIMSLQNFMLYEISTNNLWLTFREREIYPQEKKDLDNDLNDVLKNCKRHGYVTNLIFQKIHENVGIIGDCPKSYSVKLKLYDFKNNADLESDNVFYALSNLHQLFFREIVCNCSVGKIYSPIFSFFRKRVVFINFML